MTKPAIDMATERMRVQVTGIMRRLEKVSHQYQTNDEREELRKCRDWMRRHPVAYEGGR